MFEHERKKKVSGATIRSLGAEIDPGDSMSPEIPFRDELTKWLRPSSSCSRLDTMPTTTSESRLTQPTRRHK